MLNIDIYQTMDEIIKQAYEESNYAGVEKIFSITKKLHPNITRDNIKKYLENLEHEQILKRTQKTKAKNQGHITAIDPNEAWQMDIFDLSKYSTYNNGYKYIFAIVDVFTRKLYAMPMKSKSIEDTTNALDNIINKYHVKPDIITSDHDSSFLGNKFQTLLEKLQILLRVNVLDDHHALGIIDNMARRLKLIFAKIFLSQHTKNWVNHLEKVVSNYNKTDHRSLNYISPNEVEKNDDNLQMIRDLNFAKKAHKPISNAVVLKIGDKVRMRIGNQFTKSSEPQFSDKIYTVEDIEGSSIVLDNDKIKKRHDLLLKVPNETITNENSNVIAQVKKKEKINRLIKQSGVNETNIVRVKRTVKKIDKLDI
jgi:hypothetical protein